MRFRLTDVWFCVADAVTSINADIIARLYMIVNPQKKNAVLVCGHQAQRADCNQRGKTESNQDSYILTQIITKRNLSCYETENT